jgi:uncharacterized membrane protein (DUF2068 family)
VPDRRPDEGAAALLVPGRPTSLRAVTTTPSRGLSVVVAYKLGKAAIELLAVVAVLVLHAALGRDAGALSARIERHWLHGIGAVLAELVRLMAGAGDARLIVVALGGDALTSAVEGILLWRGYRWARWVVLGSTGLPLPWELVRLVRQPSVARLVLLLVNVAILGWVWWAGPGAEARARHARRHRARYGAIAAVAAVGVWLLTSYRLIPIVERHHVVAATAPAAGRTTDASGYPADPLNVGLVGEIGEVQLAMQRAGWLPARPITVLSTLGIFGAITLGRSDARAPVSDLFLDGRRQDFAFERQVGASPRRRHHVRFWEQGQRVDGQTLWLGAATFDEGVTIARANGQLTHRTSPNIDEERDTLVGDLERGGCARAVHDTSGIGSRAGARTAEGRLIETDGRVAIVELACPKS